jgi:beta-glucosidase
LNFRSEAGRVLYGEDVYVGYRYFDKVEVPPLFAFGHGLSYTTFKLSDLQLRPSDSQITLRVHLANIGSRAGAEVIQVYIAPCPSPIRRPTKELKTFQKVFLEAGKDTEVEMTLDAVRSTSYWDEPTNRWCSYGGTYTILVGTSSRGEFLQTTFDVPKTSYWTGL